MNGLTDIDSRLVKQITDRAPTDHTLLQRASAWAGWILFLAGMASLGCAIFRLLAGEGEARATPWIIMGISWMFLCALVRQAAKYRRIVRKLAEPT